VTNKIIENKSTMNNCFQEIFFKSKTFQFIKRKIIKEILKIQKTLINIKVGQAKNTTGINNNVIVAI
jgi:hypothetical protein